MSGKSLLLSEVSNRAIFLHAFTKHQLVALVAFPWQFIQYYWFPTVHSSHNTFYNAFYRKTYWIHTLGKTLYDRSPFIHVITFNYLGQHRINKWKSENKPKSGIRTKSRNGQNSKERFARGGLRRRSEGHTSVSRRADPGGTERKLYALS